MEIPPDILRDKRIVFSRLLEIFQEKGIRLPEDALHEILVCWADWYLASEPKDRFNNSTELSEVFDSKRIFFEHLLEKFGLNIWSLLDVSQELELRLRQREANELGEKISHLGDWVEQSGLRYALELYNQQ